MRRTWKRGGRSSGGMGDGEDRTALHELPTLSQPAMPQPRCTLRRQGSPAYSWVLCLHCERCRMIEQNPCPLCGALPCDWTDDPHKVEVGLCWTLAKIREVLGVNEKPMMDELPSIITAALEGAAAAFRPIETAPKDGTTIDVWRGETRETVYWGFPPHCCGEMGEYCDSDWHGIKQPGWICATFGEFVGCVEPFTHWMPIPTPPLTASNALQMAST